MKQKHMALRELLHLAPSPYMKAIRQWWYGRLERHYLMCADVEQQRAREAAMNVAHYQKLAALARSDKN